jgi:hypothetical protein
MTDSDDPRSARKPSDYASLMAGLEDMKERRAIQKAMLGPEQPPPEPTRTWSAVEAAPFLPPGRVLRRCESLPRGIPETMPWPAGPWDTEPDRFEWRSPAFPELALLAVRNRMGAWCGYVGLPPEFLHYGADHDQIDARLDAHGGLTFSGRCHEWICHTPEPGEADRVWWLGFDCLHFRDMAPGLLAVRTWAGATIEGYPSEKSLGAEFDVYRPLWWVIGETESLALQCQEQHAASQARIQRAFSRAVRHRAAMGRREKRRAVL